MRLFNLGHLFDAMLQSLTQDESEIGMNISDIRLSLDQKISNILDSFNVDVATWEETLFAVLNGKWDHPIVLVKEEIDDIVRGKHLKISSDGSPRIHPFSIRKVIGGEE